MRLRLPFVYEVDQWTYEWHRRANRWAEVVVDVAEVDGLYGQKVIRAGGVEFVEMGGRLFRLWLSTSDRKHADVAFQTILDAMMRRQWFSETPKLLPILPYMLQSRMKFRNALTFECPWSEERTKEGPGHVNLMRERAAQAIEFYSKALVYSPPGLWVEADEPVLRVRPSATRGLYAIECLLQPDLASSGYHFRADRLEDAREFAAGPLQGHSKEVGARIEFEPGALKRSDMSRLAACVLASAARGHGRPDLAAALLTNDPEKHSIAMDAAKERLLTIAVRRNLKNPLLRCAVKRWFFEEGCALRDRSRTAP